MIYKTLKSPLNVQIELTTECTNCCMHCYNFQKQDSTPDVTLPIERIAEIFSKLKIAQVPSVTITGGEPLMKMDLVLNCIEQCMQNNISCSINSNLVPLTEPSLIQMMKCGQFSILTSLASYDEKIHDIMMGRKGSFARTVSAIELLRKYNVSTSINMVVTKINAHQVYETGLLAEKLGAKVFAATKASPPLGCADYSAVQPSKEQVKKSLDDLIRLRNDKGISVDIFECYPLCFFGDISKYQFFARRRCSAGVTSGTIGSDGGFRPCSHSNRIYGNIFDESIENIYSRMTEWRTGELLPEKCMDCRYVARCSGGCRCEAEYSSEICDMDPYSGDECDVINLPCSPTISTPEFQPVSIPIDTQFREESFGYVIYRNGRSALLDDEAGRLIKNLAGKTVTAHQASVDYLCDVNDVSMIFSRLVDRKIIKLVS